MAQLLSIDVRCSECDEVWNVLATKEDLAEDTWECPHCKTDTGHRTASFPTNFRATKLMEKGAYENLKAINKLERQMYDKPLNERKGIQREIHERKKIK